VKLRAYPRYRPSGVEWLGDVPEHWGVKRLKYSASINDEVLPETTSADFEFQYVDIGGVSAVDGITATEHLVFENAPSRARRKVRHGDTIVSTVRTYLRAIAPIKNPPENLIVSTGFAVIRPRKVEPGFLAYALGEASFVESVVARSVGVSYPACNASEVGGISVPLPDAGEQQAIAGFLDRKTRQVDQLVAKKRDLIERLKEQRSKIINATMSGDLRQESERDAAKPWRYRLKPGWRRKRLKYIAEMKGRLGWQGLRSDEYTDEGPYLVSSEHFVNDRINWDQCNHVTEERFRIAPEIILRKDDVLFMKDGAAMGKLGYVEDLPGPACLNSHLLVIRPNRQHCLPRFIYFALKTKAFEGFMIQERTGTTFYGLSQQSMGNFELSYPSIDEQTRVISYLHHETARVDALVAKVEEAIDRLQEYRTALITAAVTGKIDVRSVS
jgi:type I restriction enzyme, S subunit